MKAHYWAWAAIPVLNVLQQVLLKLSAAGQPPAEGFAWMLQIMASPWFQAAIVAEVVCFVLWLTVLAELDLSRAFPLSAVSYVLVMAIAWLLFGERVYPLQIVGSGLILGGILCVATAPMAETSGEKIKNSR